MSTEAIGQVRVGNAFTQTHSRLPNATAPCAEVLAGWKVPAPLFLIPGATGKTSYLKALGAQPGLHRPVIAFRSPNFDAGNTPLLSVQDIVAHFLKEILSIQPQGPYLLAGHSFGGLVAYEIAQQLTERGQQVAHLILLDTFPIKQGQSQEGEDPEVMANHEISRVREIFSMYTDSPVAAYLPDPRLNAVYRTNLKAFMAYDVRPTEVPTTLLRARDEFPAGIMHPGRTASLECTTPSFGWAELCRQLTILEVPGDHFTLLLPPHVEVLGTTLHAVLGDGHLIPWEAGIFKGEGRSA
ncbi:Polyketide synthase [Pseudomonas chlororaphis subsp. aurantiaca]|uniref:thioesterase domain-containing protein n=1 Tax=Pseudomonas chlororaphis TaxID=587753 RepID=UPI000F57EFDF|nr:alpha/beta fold hydrolase [Pseudomonas chlororaphis]AZD21743.1 Polyketide synthase [Pseudomonas chlororaphis subsp. aurantiaca]